MNIKNKWLFGTVAVLVIILSMVCGGLISNQIFKRGFVVWQYGSDITTAVLVRGKITSGGAALSIGENKGPESLDAKLKGVGNNKDAVGVIENVVNSTGGKILFLYY